jgi:hypothetical protein
MITPLVVGATKDPTDKRKQIFSECMHIAMDNHFCGDDVLCYLREGGWKVTMTCRHDCLPKSVSRKYFNFIKATSVCITLPEQRDAIKVLVKFLVDVLVFE